MQLNKIKTYNHSSSSGGSSPFELPPVIVAQERFVCATPGNGLVLAAGNGKQYEIKVDEEGFLFTNDYPPIP
jgi:hypothetical protein